MIYSVQGGTTNGVLNGSKNYWRMYPNGAGGFVQAKTAQKQTTGIKKMASVWDTITGSLTFDNIVKGSTSLVNLRTQVQNLNNAKAAADQQQRINALQMQQMRQTQSAPAPDYGTGAPAKSNTMILAGGAVAIAVIGFLMMRKK